MAVKILAFKEETCFLVLSATQSLWMCDVRVCDIADQAEAETFNISQCIR